MEGFFDTIICQFSDPITPKLLDNKHPVDGAFWEVIQIADFRVPEIEGMFHQEHLVSLARAIGNMTISFQEQVNELALTYNISPATLNQVALNRMYERNNSELRMLLDGLLTPDLNVALAIGPLAPPSAYLNELDEAYGNVTGGEELYIQFLETHQNSGERASDYLRVAKQEADSQLLKQILRGCWDDSLITTLHLKEPIHNPFKDIFTFSKLLFKIRSFERESQLKEIRKKRHMGGSSTRVHTKTLLAGDEPEFSNHVSSELDSHNREQLEERIRQLETEIRKKAPAQIAHLLGNERAGHKPSLATPKDTRMKTGRFCYNCGQDSHMLPQCTNQTNATLVQKKLCERHRSREGSQQVDKQKTGPSSNLSLNR
ncbi:hypothetical protein Q5P01_011995 [Channa striata]|uniref:CCHC-type domain-containing protein n=1 Tax=Channa striata TaxID=64152 RepID=A0AA88SSG5_CHASR|nr:hypothetical protein Q5P01_011995 [Channa striata]